MDTSDKPAGPTDGMNYTYSTLPPADPDTATLRGIVIAASHSDLGPVPYTDGPAATAYVDGGNAAMCRTPTFAASVNRAHRCAFRGRVRLQVSGPAGRPVCRTGRRAAGRGRGPAG